MNAIELLRAEHQEILRLIEALQTTEDKAILRDLKSILAAHSYAEEQVFYPALENFDDAKRLVSEAYQEHRLVDRALTQLLDLSGSADETQKLLEALRERVERHIKLEEQRMFSRAEELFGQSLLVELGNKMKNLSDTRAHRSASR
jgi:hemerythrin-like domain-containing protein